MTDSLCLCCLGRLLGLIQHDLVGEAAPLLLHLHVTLVAHVAKMNSHRRDAGNRLTQPHPSLLRQRIKKKEEPHLNSSWRARALFRQFLSDRGDFRPSEFCNWSDSLFYVSVRSDANNICYILYSGETDASVSLECFLLSLCLSQKKVNGQSFFIGENGRTAWRDNIDHIFMLHSTRVRRRASMVCDMQMIRTSRVSTLFFRHKPTVCVHF